MIAGVGRPVASLVHAGRRYPITADEVTIGRGEDCEVVLAFERVSRHHTRIAREGEVVALVPADGQPAALEAHGLRLQDGQLARGHPRLLPGQEPQDLLADPDLVAAAQRARVASHRVAVD